MLSINKRDISPPLTSLRSFSLPSPTSTTLPLSHKFKVSTHSEDNTSHELQTTALSQAKSSRARRPGGSYASGSSSSLQAFTLPKANTSTHSQNTRPSRTTPLVHPFVEALNLLDRDPTGGRDRSSTSGSTEAVVTSLVGDHTLPPIVDHRVHGRNISSTNSSRNQDKSTRSSRLSSTRSTQSSDSKALSLEESLAEIAELLTSDLHTTQRSHHNIQPADSSRRSSARSAAKQDSQDYSLEEDLADIAKLVNAPRETWTRLKSSSSTKPTSLTTLKASLATELTSTPTTASHQKDNQPRAPVHPIKRKPVGSGSSKTPTSSEENPTDVAEPVIVAKETLSSPKASYTSDQDRANTNEFPINPKPTSLRKAIASDSSKTHTSAEENHTDIAERVVIAKETLSSSKLSSTPEQDRGYTDERLTIHKQDLPRKAVGSSSKKHTSLEKDSTHDAERVNIREKTLPSRKSLSTPEKDRAYIAKVLNVPKETLPSPKVWDTLKEERAYVAERLKNLEQTLPPPQPSISRKLTPQPAIEHRIQDHSAPTLNDTLPITQVNSPALPGDSTSRPSLRLYITQRNSSRTTKDTLSLPKVSLSGERTSRPAIGPYSEDNSSRTLKATLPSPKVAPSGELTSRPTTGPYSGYNTSPTPKPLVIRKQVNSGSKGPSYRFLGRHHSQEDTPRIARSASFGTARELRSSALTTYRERTPSLPKLPIPPRAASLGRIQEGGVPRAVLSRTVSISSSEQLRDLLSASRPPLYLDVPRRRDVDIIFPPSAVGAPAPTISRRRASGSRALPTAPPPPPTATPLIYRSASGALRDHLGPKQPVFVPARIDRRRNATASSAMATRGSSSNPFDNPPDHWQGVCPVRAESVMTQPGPVSASGANGTSPPPPSRPPPPPPVVAAAAAASAAAIAAATVAAANAAGPARAAPAPATPRRRGVFRRVGRALRRLVRGGGKE